jgi:hypothetical protein
MDLMAAIHGKIAAVITSRAVVLNRGRVHGVKKGMKFGIYVTVGPIVDPDDEGNILKQLKFRKGTITADFVYERMSYCSIEPIPGENSAISSISSGFIVGTSPTPKFPDVEAPLYGLEAKVIRGGDTVEQIVEVPKQADKSEEEAQEKSNL